LFWRTDGATRRNDATRASLTWLIASFRSIGADRLLGARSCCPMCSTT
jgi:hypothetical protein